MSKSINFVCTNVIARYTQQTILILLIAVFLSGCESMPLANSFSFWGSKPVQEDEDGNAKVAVYSEKPKDQMLTDQLVEFITGAQQGEIARIEQSPWSTNHDIMAMESYMSATGRKCRTLKMLHDIKDLPNKQFVCEDDNGEWVPIRCITR